MKQNYKNLLFICSMNLNRSPTAEELFKNKYETKSAGIDKYCRNRVDKDLLEWSDVVFVMEDWMETELKKRFPDEYEKKKVVSLDIHDYYYRNDPALIKILKREISKYL